jgi:hypothetical protein
MDDLQIYLYKKDFEKNKKDYFESWKKENPNETEDEFESYIIQPKIEVDDMGFCDDELDIALSLKECGKLIGTISLTVGIDSDVAGKIIECYVKKYNKIKTIIEATK